MAGPCNSTSVTIPDGVSIQGPDMGYIEDLIVTSSSYFISTFAGIWAKFMRDLTLVWSFTFTTKGYAIALSTDELFLITSGEASTTNSRFIK